MSNQSSLKERLQEKEELVAALTERLEMAAEQLDRLRRTGAGRGGGSGSSLPPDLVERHESLTEDLQRAVQQWEDMQAAALLGRLEVQVSELRDLIVTEVIGRLGGGADFQSAEGTAASSDSRKQQAGDGIRGAGAERETSGRYAPTSGDAESSAESDESPTAGQSHWDTVKAALLEGGGEVGAPRGASETSEPGTAELEATADLEEAGRTSQPAAEPIDAVDPPQPVDFEAADQVALRTAIEARDEYITYLIKKLRSAGSTPRLPVNWDDLQGLPDELRSRVEELQSRLDETLRMSEVELSLERARLAREEVRLRQLDENLQKSVRQFGLQSGGENELEQGEQPGSGSRWLRMLGIGRDTDEEDEEDEDG